MDVTRTATLSSSFLISPCKELARVEFSSSWTLLSYTGVEEVTVLRGSYSTKEAALGNRAALKQGGPSGDGLSSKPSPQKNGSSVLSEEHFRMVYNHGKIKHHAVYSQCTLGVAICKVCKFKYRVNRDLST